MASACHNNHLKLYHLYLLDDTSGTFIALLQRMEQKEGNSEKNTREEGGEVRKKNRRTHTETRNLLDTTCLSQDLLKKREDNRRSSRRILKVDDATGTPLASRLASRLEGGQILLPILECGAGGRASQRVRRNHESGTRLLQPLRRSGTQTGSWKVG